MRKIIIAALMAAGSMLASEAANAGYSAIAASVVGTGRASGFSTMEGARAAAVRLCRAMGGSCSASTAEDDSWFFAAGVCNGVAYTAASPAGVDRATQLVFVKGQADGRPTCRITNSF